jgi:hypothetical protein
MIQFTSRIRIWCVLALLAANLVATSDAQEDWNSLLKAALRSRAQADRCLRFGATGTVPDLLRSAAVSYIKMSKLLNANSTSEQVAVVANGLSQSGRSDLALELLLSRYDINDDPVLEHLFADILAMYPTRQLAAGLAYERWIAKGCKGYLYTLDRPSWIAKRKNILKFGQCANLPTGIRSRLEALRNETGHPKNLPKRNFPPLDFNHHEVQGLSDNCNAMSGTGAPR